MKKKVIYILENSSNKEKLNEDTIEVEVPAVEGGLRKVSLQTAPMFQFVIDRVLNA